MFKPQDHYFKQAKKEGFKARSAFKLLEIDDKFKIFNKDETKILDIGCAPGSWLQLVAGKMKQLSVTDFKLIGFDLKKVDIGIPGVYTYEQDITQLDTIDEILASHDIDKFDIIISDMAPNTIGMKDIDAIRSIGLLEKTLPIYEKYLKIGGKFVIKIFMGPGFDEFLSDMKKVYGAKYIKTLKPKAVRKESKEIYIINIGGGGMTNW